VNVDGDVLSGFGSASGSTNRAVGNATVSGTATFNIEMNLGVNIDEVPGALIEGAWSPQFNIVSRTDATLSTTSPACSTAGSVAVDYGEGQVFGAVAGDFSAEPLSYQIPETDC
jgi:hypothetical protein